jgi:hypothetical protein
MQLLSSLLASNEWIARVIAAAILLAGMSGDAGAVMLLGTQVELTTSGYTGITLNTSGPFSAVIADPASEFSISFDGAFTADFTDNTVTITFFPTNPAPIDSFTFRDSAFVGLTLAEVSSTFDDVFFAGQKGLKGTLDGDTLTFASRANIRSMVSQSATFSFAQGASAVPEPASLTMLSAGGLGVLGTVLLRRKRRGV